MGNWWTGNQEGLLSQEYNNNENKKQVAINQNGLLVRKSEGWLFAVEAHKSSNAGRLALAVTSCNVDKC